MALDDLHLPGLTAPIEDPETFITGVLRNFGDAAQVLGAATDRLVMRLASPRPGRDPDYQIQTIDGEDAAAFSGTEHNFLDPDDVTVRFEEDDLQDQTYTIEQVKDWLNRVNGEGESGGPLNPILTEGWEEGDQSDPRD
ncbi:hypothetical protein [Propylenella binzhouense]|uniref:Uncharacterized protein n=1 Tax=Propylenella binzhouense TaxID=2555902 RepID=A0A964T5F7_9HYPH|nr:hypothetical protein [Propylenella binzhouense]MYZ48729.1 hypothetical protein [Propylenella binzhouense]